MTSSESEALRRVLIEQGQHSEGAWKTGRYPGVNDPDLSTIAAGETHTAPALTDQGRSSTDILETGDAIERELTPGEVVENPTEPIQ